MSYVMQRGTFHVLKDEWDFQGFEIQSESTSASTVTVTDSRGGAIDIPVNTAPPSFLQRPTSSSINSAARNNIITTLTTAVSGLGSDLVTNGNYDLLSSELVTNGDFATDSDWTKGTGWSIANGVASCDGSQSSTSNFSQGNTFDTPPQTLSDTYKITFDLIVTQGSITVSSGNLSQSYTTSGTKILYGVPAVGAGNLNFTAGSTFIGSIDNVSVKQVDPDDDWTKGTGWSIQDDQAQFSGGSDAALEQAGVFTEGTKYKVSIDVAEISGGELEVKDQTTIHQAITSAGGYEFTFTAANTALQLNANTGSVERTIKINSITAQEVSSTTSLAINSIGEAIFATGDKFSLLNINNNTTYDLTINANQSASDTTLTITSFDFEAIVPVGSIVTFNKKNLIKQYQDDTLQEVTDNGNTTTNSIMIGSSSAPAFPLDIKGTANALQLTNSDYVAGVSGSRIRFTFGSSTGNTFAKIQTTDIGGLSASNLILQSDSGNVGIGTSSPSQGLHVLDAGILVSQFESSNNTVSQIQVTNSSGNDAYFGTSGSRLVINNNDYTANHFNIDSSGHVGIGATSPPKNLTIEFDSNNTNVNSGEGLGGGVEGKGVLIKNTNTLANSYANLDFRANNADGRIAYKFNSINDGDFHFITDDGNNPSTKLIILNAGNVGIGTTSPQSKADINGTLRVIGQVTPSGGAGLEIGYSGAGKLRAIDRATTTYKLLDFIASKFTFKIDGTEKMRLSDDGRLGISTSTPETELDVNGTCTSQLLQLRRQDSTPSEPETDKSIIFMDSNGDIKVLINVGGTTVTRTLATYA